MKGILAILKLLIKYGAVIMVIIDILNYSVEKFESLYLKKSKTEDKNIA